MSRKQKWDAEFEDEIRRTDFEGQLGIDGVEVEQTRVRPKPTRPRAHPRPAVPNEPLQLSLSGNDSESS